MAETKVAIVTGAGSGIGRACAILLAEAGFAVVLVGRTRAKLAETAAMVTGDIGEGAVTRMIEADLCDERAPAQVADEAFAAFGRVDVLVNVAGAAPLQPIEQITPGIWRETIDVNLSAPVLLTAAVWPVFQQQGSGFVANLSSMASVDPFPGFSIYAAAKVGLNMFTKCTADEGKAIGVRAVCVAPGAVETPMLRGLFGESVIPRERTLAARDVAAVIRDCITGARPFTSGETIALPSP